MLLKVNITKGWPNPHILEQSADADPTTTGIEAGKIGVLNGSNKWVLGVTSVNQIPYVLMQDQDDPDTGRANVIPDAVSVKYGGIQGIALSNPIEIEDSQFVTNAGLVADAPVTVENTPGVDLGKLKLAVNVGADVVVAVVRKAAYTLDGVNYLTVIPVAPHLL
jgi:hypothetical protein